VDFSTSEKPQILDIRDFVSFVTGSDPRQSESPIVWGQTRYISWPSPPTPSPEFVYSEPPMDLMDLVRGCTFDDFLLTPQLGVVASRDPDAIDLSTVFARGIPLRRPLVSANMDTITRAAMATVLAEEGGIGVIDRGYRAGDVAPQVA